MQLGDCPPLEEPALIGVSGGRDSVALLHALVARGHRLVVCHLDHALRPQSRDDAHFVEKLAVEFDCECVVRRVNVAARARRTTCSLETAAREMRYAFFAQVARGRGIRQVFLAHHADDQVETLLFNLLRGTGAAGLAAMRPVSTRKIGRVQLDLTRPLLGVWRAEIDAYLATYQLAWREDASNADPQHTRNRLRHEIVPALTAAFGRDVRAALWRSAAILREEDAFLSARPELAAADAPELRVAEVRALPLALQRRLLQAWLRVREVSDVGFVEIERVRTLLAGRAAKVNLPGDHHARRRAGRLFVE